LLRIVLQGQPVELEKRRAKTDGIN